MDKREMLDELPVRPSENICTGCFVVPPEWYRDGEVERCVECNTARNDSEPAVSMTEKQLAEALD
jgi:hypothetical protein